ncbi:MAG: NfeD family protein [Deinococcales bacterium]
MAKGRLGVMGVILALLGALGMVFAQSATNIAGVLLRVEGEIQPTSAVLLKKQLEQAAVEKRPLVVIEIQTPGGRVDAAIEMSDAIVSSKIPTLAVVRNAFSAGALIAMSAEQLAMLPGSEIGAALPITGAGQAIQGDVGEKINSAVRGKFRSVAETRGRNKDAAEGMVNPNKVIAGLKERGEILTLTAPEAVKNNIADFTAQTVEDAVRQAGFANLRLEKYELSTAEQVGAFLTNPIVAGILLAIGVMGILIELFHPGLAAPGIIGGVSLVAYFMGGLLTGSGSTVAFILFIAGLLLIMAELLLIPGTTIVGLLGAGSIVASIYLQFGQNFGMVAGIAAIAGGLGLGLALWKLPKSTLLNRSIFLNTTLADMGTGTAMAGGGMPHKLEGRYGSAVTDLRPSGVANIEGERVDVVSDGEFVKAGTMLEVIRVEGNRIVVKTRS